MKKTDIAIHRRRSASINFSCQIQFPIVFSALCCDVQGITLVWYVQGKCCELRKLIDSPMSWVLCQVCWFPLRNVFLRIFNYSYSVFLWPRQAKFAYGGSILSSSQFLLLPRQPPKMILVLKVVKFDSKIIILLPWSKSMKQTVLVH
jgi:hypothetical protein